MMTAPTHCYVLGCSEHPTHVFAWPWDKETPVAVCEVHLILVHQTERNLATEIPVFVIPKEGEETPIDWAAIAGTHAAEAELYRGERDAAVERAAALQVERDAALELATSAEAERDAARKRAEESDAQFARVAQENERLQIRVDELERPFPVA